jgi:hypothetical protein
MDIIWKMLVKFYKNIHVKYLTKAVEDTCLHLLF